MKQSHITSNDGVKIKYYMSGTGKSYLFFVHAWPYNHSEWRKQTDYFKDNYKIVTLDLRGFGASDKPLNRNDYTFDKIASDIKLILDKESIKKATFLGHCSGGMIVIDFYRRYPQYFNKMIIIGCPYLKPLKHLTGFLGNKLGRATAGIFAFFFSMFKTKHYDFNKYEHCFRDDGLNRGYRFLQAVRRSKLRIVYHYVHHLVRFDAGDTLTKIKVPLLMIFGANDDFCGNGLQKNACDTVRGRVVLIKDSTHFPQIDCPKFVNKEIELFLK